MGDACATESACDEVGGFVCTEWTKGETKNPKCAMHTDCGKTIGDEEIVCTAGVFGDPCKSNKGMGGKEGCDADIGLKCGEEFNTTSFQFGGSATCIDGADCGQNVTGKAGNVHLCYGEGAGNTTSCNTTHSCAVPDGSDAKSLACGYIYANESGANGTHEVNVTHMCIDSDKYCTANGGDNITDFLYFGTKVTLHCASARNVLAMGAALISTYYAM